MTDQTLEQVITAWYTDDACGSHLDFDDVPALVKRLTAALPTREQIAFRLRQTAHLGSLDQADAVLALLSQPTPTAEPDRVVITRNQIENGVREVFDGTWPDPDETPALVIAAILARSRYLPAAEPPRVEDMAPGTHAYVEGRFGDDGICHAHTPGVTNYSAWPDRCYRPRADRAHDVTPPAVTS